jgi:hypothetical protein
MHDQSPRPPRPLSDGSDNECRELEQALATLRPDAGPIDRDRLMFLAGRATIERAMVERPWAGGMTLPKWMWPGATAVSTIAATVLGLLLAISQRPLVVREPVYVHAPVPPQQVLPPQFEPQPGRGLPGAMASDGLPGTPGMMEMTAEAPTAARVDVARVDYVPRTTLPPVSYVQKRQLALALGVEALGSGTPPSGAEHPVAYHELLGDMVRGVD